MRSLLALVLSTLASVALADLSVEVKRVYTVQTTTPTISTQMVLEDGTPIGQATTTTGEPTVGPKQEAAALVIRSDRDLNDTENVLLKIRCDTASFTKLAPNGFVTDSPGTHSVRVMVLGQNPLSWDEELVRVVVGKPIPPPPPPPPPLPDNPAPIDGPGFRVLFLAESGERLPAEIEDAFYSREIGDWLNANCIQVDGQPDFRRLDPDSQFTDANHRFAKALARPRTAMPWLIISNGVTGYEGQFPGGKNQTLELLKKYKTPQKVLR